MKINTPVIAFVITFNVKTIFSSACYIPPRNVQITRSSRDLFKRLNLRWNFQIFYTAETGRMRKYRLSARSSKGTCENHWGYANGAVALHKAECFGVRGVSLPRFVSIIKRKASKCRSGGTCCGDEKFIGNIRTTRSVAG